MVHGAEPWVFMALRKKRLGRPDIALAAQAKIDGPTFAIHRSVQVHPLAADLHVGLVDAPRWAGRPGEPVPAAFELRCVIVHPAHDGGVSQRKAALRHHLHQIAVAELEPQVPPHAQDDDLPVEVAALEQLIQCQEPGHHTAFSLLEARDMGAQTVCTRALRASNIARSRSAML